MTWLRQRATSDWITLPSHIYIKCLRTFPCSGWPYGCIPRPSKPGRWVELAKPEYQLGTNQTTMTWLRPRATSDWITLPSNVYIKCLSMFTCSGWSYGCISMPSKPWRWIEFAEPGQQLGTNHTNMTWLRPRTTSDWITLPSHTYIKCLSTFPCSGWPYGCISSLSKP